MSAPPSPFASLPRIRRLLDELKLRPLSISHSEAYGIVELWRSEDGHLDYGRDLAEYIGPEGDETAGNFTELIVLTLNVLPDLLAKVEQYEEGQYGA